MSRYREQVAAALAAVRIRGPVRYAWLGRASRLPDTALLGELDAPTRRAYLLACLREELYWSFYCRGGVVRARWGEPEPASADARLTGELAAANAGRGRWEPGWTVERVDGDRAVVTSPRGLRARAALADCRVAPEPGEEISLRASADRPGLSPGFFTLIGDAGDETGAGVVRVYWHVTPGGAPALVRELTAALNAEDVAFRLKVADHPLRFDRCDAAVLYLPAGRFAAQRAGLASLAARLAKALRPRVPALTLALAEGVGLAEDDGAGESFGARRCELLAEGILDAHEHGGAGLDAVIARFARAGVDIDAPYRQPGVDVL